MNLRKTHRTDLNYPKILIKFFYFLSSFFIINIFISCVNLNQNDLVLKKSSDPAPFWLNENGKINSQNPNYINLVFMKSDLYNLPLGLKQSQKIASIKLSSLLFAEIQKQILEKIEKKIIFNDKKTTPNHIVFSISRAVNKCLADFKIAPPLAEQVYWEYREQESSQEPKHYYVVWVLLLVPKTVYDKALLTVAHELQSSHNDALVTLGNDMLQQPNKR